MASTRLTPIDILNEYYARLKPGQKLPKLLEDRLKALAAGTESLQEPRIDPVMTLGTLGVGGALAGLLPAAEFAATNELWNQAMQLGQYNDPFYAPAGQGLTPEDTAELPKILSKPTKGLNEVTKPLSMGPPITGELNKGPWAKTGPLKEQEMEIMAGDAAQTQSEFDNLFENLMAGSNPEKVPTGPGPKDTKGFENQNMLHKQVATEPLKGINPATGLDQTGLTSFLNEDDQLGMIGDMIHNPSVLGKDESQQIADLLGYVDKSKGKPTEMLGKSGGTKGLAGFNASNQFGPQTQGLSPLEMHSQWGWPAKWEFDPELGFETGKYGKETGILPGTAAFNNRLTQHAVPTGELSIDNRTMGLEEQDIEDMVREGGTKPRTAELIEAAKKNLSPADTLPLPENTLYHGIHNVFGSTTPSRIIPGVAEEGLKGGWFSEEPHPPFGPNYIATTPEKLPKLITRNKQFNVDPETEIIPNWAGTPTKELEDLARKRLAMTPAQRPFAPADVKGRPVLHSLYPNIHQFMGADENGKPLETAKPVPPEDLFLAGQSGDIIGRLAPKNPARPNRIRDLFQGAASLEKNLRQGAGLEKADPATPSSFWDKWFPNEMPVGKEAQIAKLQKTIAAAGEHGGDTTNPTMVKLLKELSSDAMKALKALTEKAPKSAKMLPEDTLTILEDLIKKAPK